MKTHNKKMRNATWYFSWNCDVGSAKWRWMMVTILTLNTPGSDGNL